MSYSQRTYYSEYIPFDAQRGDFVTGTVQPVFWGVSGVSFGIMDNNTVYNCTGSQWIFTATACTGGPYAEYISSSIDSNNVLHFSWMAPSTGHYYFSFLNSNFDNGVTVEFAVSITRGIIVSSTEYQKHTNRLLQTLVVSSIYSTSYSSLQIPQFMNPPLALLVGVVVVAALGGLILYSRRRGEEKTVRKPRRRARKR